jgi:tetratricopeptide (TPR) repeat protein
LKALLGLLLLLASAATAKPHHVDDYAGARAAAQAAGDLLVIDLWAPWCHTCLSMQQTVLADPAVAERPHLTWLAVDTDRPVNRAVVAQFPPQVWPTFFVVDPVDERVLGRWQGSASVAQFAAFLEAAHTRAADDTPNGQVRTADRLAITGRYAEAEATYGLALAAASKTWPRRPSVLVDRIGQRLKLKDHAGCLDLGISGLDDAMLGHTPSAADFVYYLHTCATQLPRTARAEQALRRAAIHLNAITNDPATKLSVDDHSELLRILREVYWAIGQHQKAVTTAYIQQALLERAVIGVPPKVAMIYGWPRCEVAVYLNRGATLEPKLAQIAEALPKAYDPAYRLAWLRLKLGRLAQARAAAEQASAHVYGPRALRVLKLLAEIQTRQRDTIAADATWAELVQRAQAEPRSPQRDAILAEAAARAK